MKKIFKPGAGGGVLTIRKIVGWSPLFLISSLGLFLEMTIIRWMSAEIRLLAYFKNLPLLAAFLGLAIGFGLVGRNKIKWPSFAVLFACFVGIVLALGRATSSRPLTYPGKEDEFIWFTADYSYWITLAIFLGTLAVFFMLTMLLFIPLGQATGEEMARHEPVPAYIVNLLASLAGIWLFALVSFFTTPPVVWFGIFIIGIVIYLAYRKLLSWTDIVLYSFTSVVLFIFGRGVVWSPYHRLEVHELRLPRVSNGQEEMMGYNLTIQQVFYQIAMDLSPARLLELGGDIPAADNAAHSYDLPYKASNRQAEVLIVGAGMGNDVAAALRNGAKLVDAVEIDPSIIELGYELHPEAPYSDSRVNAVVDDARSFFEKRDKKYDVIVFGLLDSHILLSSLSNVRLDSFVYTLNSFEQAKSLLKEDGILALTFAVGEPWIEQRLGRMLVEVFGEGEVYYYSGWTGTTFIAGETSPDRITENSLLVWQPSPDGEAVPLATDDWPYLYLRDRRVPIAYWQTLLFVGLICALVIARSFRSALRPLWHFWFLGAAFLLIEFKSITEFALLFGTTWLVNVLAVSGVLMMALGANLVVLRWRRLNLRVVYALLFASLTFNYFVPLKSLVGLEPVLRAIISMVLLSLPLFFAGLIFGTSLRRARETARPLASNLAGSVAGGVLEYGSLIGGIKSLYLIAGLVYAGALIAYLVQKD